MTTLYADGWRQGSVFRRSLPLDAVILGDTGQPVRAPGMHEEWVVASQDCELAQTDTGDPSPTVELRPVYHESPPSDIGIRSARFLLTSGKYAVSNSPRTSVSAAVLTAALTAGAHGRAELTPGRATAWKTWLGLRYDRPAVPPELVDLARRIADETTRKRRRPTGEFVRDVLMQFDSTSTPTRFSLFAVIEDAADATTVREWLADIAMAIPTELGVADILEAGRSDQISLSLIETSYAADLTQLTWGVGEEPRA